MRSRLFHPNKSPSKKYINNSIDTKSMPALNLSPNKNKRVNIKIQSTNKLNQPLE
jgi:hypothetical protein